MRRRCYSLAIATSLAMSLVFPSASTTATQAEQSHELTESLKFRETFGLRSDAGYVLSLVTDASLPRAEWGVPLTDQELNEMDRRRSISEALDDLYAYIGSTEDTFGGLFIDQAAGGVVDVAFTKDPESHHSALIKLLPPDTALRSRVVDHTWRELQQLQDVVNGDGSWHASIGTIVFSTSPIPQLNQIEVGVSDDSADIKAEFAKRYGNAVVAVPSGAAEFTACSSRESCAGPSFRGGVKITGPSYPCSNAFFVYQNGVVRYMTAGHCASIGSVYTHPGLPGGMSTVKDNSYADNTTADAATVGNVTGTWNNDWIYRTSTTVWDIDTYDTGIGVGDPVCLSGYRAAATRCGTILTTSVDVCVASCATSNPFMLLDQIKASYTWYFGDSGGAVHNGSMAMGIQSACIDGPDADNPPRCTEGGATGDRALYSHILNAFTRLGDGIALYQE